MSGNGATREDLGSGPILQPDPGTANWKANTSPFMAAHRDQAAVNAQLPTAHMCHCLSYICMEALRRTATQVRQVLHPVLTL